MASPSFESLPLSEPHLRNLAQLGYRTPTPIQQQTLPVILEGKDVIGRAKTGSGKTAAFGLGILHRLNPDRRGVQALVICPTRELVEQVAAEVRRLARASGNVKVLTLTGGSSARPQIESLGHGAHIVVGTPGRLLDLMDRGLLDLSAIHTLVLDEADRMVDMGFFADVMEIVQSCPTARQTMLFSATYPETIRKDVDRLLRSPEMVETDTEHDEGQIQQQFYEVAEDRRFESVANLLRIFQPEAALLFCNTRAACVDLTAYLAGFGFSVKSLHGDMDQRDRDDVFAQFANQSCRLLVATDVAARGLDIPELPMVMNVELARDASVHVHRVGRTGRMQQSGLALSLVSPEEQHVAARIAEFQNIPIKMQKVPRPAADAGPIRASMATLLVLGGKKAKLRPGDLLGALIRDLGLERDQVGKISISDQVSHVAIERGVADRVLRKRGEILVKGKKQRIKIL